MLLCFMTSAHLSSHISQILLHRYSISTPQHTHIYHSDITSHHINTKNMAAYKLTLSSAMFACKCTVNPGGYMVTPKKDFEGASYMVKTEVVRKLGTSTYVRVHGQKLATVVHSSDIGSSIDDKYTLAKGPGGCNSCWRLITTMPILPPDNVKSVSCREAAYMARECEITTCAVMELLREHARARHVRITIEEEPKEFPTEEEPKEEPTMEEVQGDSSEEDSSEEESSEEDSEGGSSEDEGPNDCPVLSHDKKRIIVCDSRSRQQMVY